LQSGEEVAKCPSCSLMIKVIYDIVSNMALYIIYCTICASYIFFLNVKLDDCMKNIFSGLYFCDYFQLT